MVLLLVQLDVVFVDSSRLEGAAVLEVDPADSTHIIHGGVLVHHPDLQVGIGVGYAGDVDNIVPVDVLSLLTGFVDPGSVFRSSSCHAVGLDEDVVFHVTEGILAFVEVGEPDGHVQSAHAKQLMCK